MPLPNLTGEDAMAANVAGSHYPLSPPKGKRPADRSAGLFRFA